MMEVSTVPIMIVDIVFSTVAIGLSIWSTLLMIDICRRKHDVVFFRYLFIMALALSLFCLSRGGGHILKNILLLTGRQVLWTSISPFTGAINTLVFIVLGLVFVLNIDVGRITRQLTRTKILAERAVSDLRFKSSVLDAMEYPALVIGPDYRVIEANRAACRDFGISEDKGPIYCYQITHGLEHPCEEHGITCLMKKTFTLKDTFRTIHRHRTTQGQRFHYVTYTPVFQDDRCQFVLETIRDITEDIDRQRRVRRRLKDIYEFRQTSALRSLVSGVAHEFNNVLAGILGNAEILKLRTRDNPELQRYIIPIMEAAQKAATFVRQMCLYTQETSLRKDHFDLGEFLDGFVSTVRLPDSITLRYDRQNIPLPLHADRDSIGEAISHIVKNSIDAMPEGGTLSITLTVENIKAREYAVIKITDTGHGISPEDLEHVFEPFWTTKDVGKGTGLGLCMAKGVIEAHGGTIRISSTPSRGTEVTIHLPLT